MKRLICLLLCIGLLAGFACGCGKADKARVLFNVELEDYIELGEYKNIPVDTKSDTFKEYYDDIIVSDVLENDFHDETITEGIISKGDIANIDYEGKKDGVAFDGGTAQGYDLEIGSGSFIDGFEGGLIGVNIGETVDLNLTFPENYSSADLAGAEVIFTVKVNSAKPAKSPKEFYADLGYKSYDEYNASVKENAIKNYLVDAIEANSKIKDFPEADIESVYAATENTIGINLENNYGMSLDDYITQMGQTKEEFKKSMITEQVEPMLKKLILYYAVLDAEGIEIEASEIDKMINDEVKAINNSSVDAKYLKEFYGDYYFEAMVANEKAIELLYDNAKIS
ncbi:MAG: FKBP-type peptidyl-prolyl cis-trans isomerase [Clostridia bacterium]|nr:FKBP-type peptidyl-prolyl cis-trans isomerase [Clostridia bacterium]